MATGAQRLAAEIADLRRRLEGLERSASADLRSIDDGTFTAYDENGDPVVEIGLQEDGTYKVRGLNGGEVVADAAVPDAITETEIQDDSISTPKIRANAVSAYHLEAVMAIVNRLVAGDPDGARAEMNGSGFSAFDVNGVRTFQVDENGNVEVVGSVQSSDYVESETGWRLDSNMAQFTNLNTIEELGADTTSTRALQVDGSDLATEIVPSLSTGALAYGQAFNASNDSVQIDSGTNSGNGFVIAKFAPGEIQPDRFYAIHWHLTVNPSQAMQVNTRLTYTTDGTYPGAAGAVLPGSNHFAHAQNQQWVTVNGFSIYDPGGGTDPVDLRIGIVARTDTGAGSFFRVKYAVPYKPEIYLVDLGPRGDAPKALSLQHIDDGSSSGGSNESDPVQTYSDTYIPTWGRSFDGDGSIWTNYGNETNDLYQGYYSGTHGNTKSMVGYDDTKIRNRLGGASIKKVELTFRVKHSYQGSGLDVRIGTHNSSGKPSTFQNVHAEVAQRNGVNAGSTVTVTLPDWVGNDLKNGNVRGITFGPGEDLSRSWYGYLYGPGSGSAPKLRITYEK